MFTLLIGDSKERPDVLEYLNILRKMGNVVVFVDHSTNAIDSEALDVLTAVCARIILFGCDVYPFTLNGIGVEFAGKVDVSPHPTIKQSPVQVRAFWEMIGRIYRTHLDKNADYSPANILGTGDIGVVTRLWDKVARLLNLTGFILKMEKSEYVAPKQPKNESVEDSFLDLASYGIIGYLLLKDQWGR